jgi:hypothetical protein
VAAATEQAHINFRQAERALFRRNEDVAGGGEREA